MSTRDKGLVLLAFAAAALGLKGYLLARSWYLANQRLIDTWTPAVVVVLLLAAAGVATLLLLSHARREERLKTDRGFLREADRATAASRRGKWLEHQAARLLREASGCARSGVSGGAKDRGLDAWAVHTQAGRVVAQCKQYKPDRNVGSGAIQTYLGTCWDILMVDGRPADIALFITTAYFSDEALTLMATPRLVRGRPRVVIPVDRDALAAWNAGRWDPIRAALTQEV